MAAIEKAKAEDFPFDGWRIDPEDAAVIENANGDWMLYDGPSLYGQNTYVLDTEVDGWHVDVEIHADNIKDAIKNANEFSARIATGWRPVNWRHGEAVR